MVAAVTPLFASSVPPWRFKLPPMVRVSVVPSPFCRAISAPLPVLTTVKSPFTVAMFPCKVIVPV